MCRRHVIAAIVIAAIIGCKNMPTSKIGGHETEAITIDTSACLTNGASPKCHVYINVKYIKGDKSAKINQIIAESGIFPPEYTNATTSGSNMKSRARDFTKNYLECYKKELAPLFKATPELAKLYERDLRLTTHMKSERDGVLTYSTSLNEISGDGSTTRQTKTTNINLKTIRKITTDDMFVHGSEAFIKRLLYKKLCKKFKAKDINALNNKGILTNEDIYIPDNFIIGHRHITFIFNSDEIAPHDIGEIRITINDEELGKLLRI